MDGSDYILSVFKLEQLFIGSLSQQQMESSTPASQKNICQPFHSTDILEQISENNEQKYEIAPLNGRTFSFHEQSSSHLQTFCTDFLHLVVLEKISKRLTDPNVVLLNTTQKDTVQSIIDANKGKTNDTAKFLTQRAGKYMKILWKAQLYNDAFYEKLSPPKIQKEAPHYTSPIHNFKKPHKLTMNNSFGSLSNKSDRSKSYGSNPGRSPKIINPPGVKIQKRKEVKSNQSSRIKGFQSQDQKFDKIRLSPKANYHKGKIKQNKNEQKLINIDLRANLAEKTIHMTTQFQNMLKILKQHQK